MPVATSLSDSSLSQGDFYDDGKDRLLDLLNGKRNGEVDECAIRPQPMDVILDACWAVMSEIRQLDDLPAGLKDFKNKCTHFKDLTILFLDEKMFTKIALVRNSNDSYEIVEKIGTGAYGNVTILAICIELRIVGVFGEKESGWKVLCNENNFQGTDLPSTRCITLDALHFNQD